MSREVPSDVPPAAFGRFRVLHQIGVGSLGPVFRGEDPETREAVAIKQLRLNLPPEKANQVSEGLRALISRLPVHPGLLRVFDAGLHHLDPYVVTALATGESLDVALREYGPAAIVDALPRLQRVAEALDRAAKEDIWHGALQPRDILVSGQNTQIAGVGVLPVLQRAGVRRPARRPYSAPEVVDGGPTSAASDQYALSAIAYEWLFGGRAPRSAESVLDAPALQGVNAEALASALMTALSPDPARRFATCTSFIEALRAAVTDAASASKGAEERASPRPAVLPLSLDFREPAGTDAILPDDHIVEIVPPVVALSDLDLDADLHSAPLHVAPQPEPKAAPAKYKPEPVAWQGSLGGSSEPERPTRGGFAASTLIAAVIVGVAVGGVGGYLIGSSRGAQDDPAGPIAKDQPAATAPATPGREFTDAPVPGGAPPASKTPQPATPVPAPASDTARLLVRTSPAGASVAVDGAPRGTTPLTLRDLALGTRTLVISRPGYVPVERSITLTADRPSRSVEVQLTPVARPARASRAPAAAPTTAALVVDSRPSGASVIIDGKLTGTTPLNVASIAPGRHAVRIELVGYRPLTHTVELKAGERLRLAASLEAGQEDE